MPTQPGCPDPKCDSPFCKDGYVEYADGKGHPCHRPSHRPDPRPHICGPDQNCDILCMNPEPTVNEGPYVAIEDRIKGEPTEYWVLDENGDVFMECGSMGSAQTMAIKFNKVRAQGVSSCQEKIKDKLENLYGRCEMSYRGGYNDGPEYDAFLHGMKTVSNVVNNILETFGKGGAK